ncbi:MULTISPECIES: tRNA (adenosine(37)-N6)-threonylcarbamoyltransferase complex dimerization subunit type 1 TsaB [unclassified Saccharicrinis]|uniref:tRNA (adenosine(37)-N6)-threonylcarbamoyltransferase complex dimerization subunit type 1 TsaB n=1 Tax=unclassified Saccharicrinis TaxID=2646859 RepID=UPI003D33CDD2
MAIILSLETSTKVCSVCLSNNHTIVAKKELFEANSHATHLTVFIQDLFNDLPDLSINDIDAVAVSSGPGSYTGLRIGVSVAKGICYALHKPLIAITSLECLAQAVINHSALKGKTSKDTLFCPMIDARRMEVYTALFNADMKLVEKISARIIDEDSYKEILDKHPMVFLGDGAEKCKDTIVHSNALFLDGQSPLASNMVNIAHKKFENSDFEDVAYFEPFYLKDFVATTPKKKVL